MFYTPKKLFTFFNLRSIENNPASTENQSDWNKKYFPVSQRHRDDKPTNICDASGQVMICM